MQHSEISELTWSGLANYGLCLPLNSNKHIVTFIMRWNQKGIFFICDLSTQRAAGYCGVWLIHGETITSHFLQLLL